MAHCPHCGAPCPEGATYCGSCGMALAPAQARSDRTLKTILAVAIGGGCLLLLLFVGGIVAALIIPNFLDALQKAKSKRTLADMQTVAAALESYRAQTGGYPATGGEVGAQLAGHGYQGDLQDGWKRPLRYSCLAQGDGCTSYELASGGRDGVFEHEPGQYSPGAFPPVEYDSDIVMSDGMFNRWPEGRGRLATGGG